MASLLSLPSRLAERTLAATSSLPSLADWVTVATAICLYGVVALPIGISSRFLRPTWDRSPARWLTAAMIGFLIPGLLEEWLFRVLLLPHPQVDTRVELASLLFWVASSILLFVGYHLSPLHQPRHVFRDRRFLVLVSLLGTACTLVYLSTGSLWCAAWTHAVPFVIWLCGLGGVETLGMEPWELRA
ncbi:unnamed protein product [Ostreobium quekettii]|uniref:CAAX prenyl protease 2/Lysostaphin resistance protein A-like domain-containing protein n=1 Tax=Ostreobium quekettii TaxID=121088 RepID=A0A8S1IPK1_9CHLO|nr:unnamed protein product [Ostreobium quekettii]|eukprot:evm.model.scf_1989.2 EVM.evm.TU.scf_1989.2   scf_1989:19352-19912(-)